MGDIGDISQAVLIVVLIILICAVVSLITSEYREDWPEFVRDPLDLLENVVDGVFGWTNPRLSTAATTDTPEGGTISSTKGVTKKNEMPTGSVKIQIGDDARETQVPEPYYPDGVSVVLPPETSPEFGNRFFAVLPEAYNMAGFTTSPFFEDSIKDLQIVNSLGSYQQRFPFPSGTSPNAGTFWLFGVFKVPGKSGRWVGMVHGERHPLGSAPPTFKSILVTYSNDLKTWTPPVPVIEIPRFNGQDGVWGGSGDPSFVYDTEAKEYRAYFFEKDRGCGVARSKDPEARTWEVWKGGSNFENARQANDYKRLPFNAGNPQCIEYRMGNGKRSFMMVAGEWGASQLTVGFSADGYNWGNITRVPFPASPNGSPLYLHVVHKRGGTVWTDGKDMRIYYSDTTGSRRRMMSRSITITF